MNARKRILLVDDDSIQVETCRCILSPLHDVLVARDGQEGHEIAIAHRPDLVVTGIHMPRMSGIELVRQLRVAPVWVPIIILSGWWMPEEEAEAKLLGVSEMIQKPFSVPQLLAAMSARIPDVRNPERTRPRRESSADHEQRGLGA